MKSILFCLLFTMGGLWFLNSGLSQEQAESQQDHLIVIVDTLTEEDSIIGNPEYTDAFVYQRLHKLYPNAYPLFIQSSDGEEIKEQLKRNIRENNLVDAFVLISHGDYDSQTGHAVVFNSDSFSMYPDLAFDVRDYFSPLIGRFSPNAKIIFYGCLLLSTDESPAQLLNRMRNVASNFGLESGNLYMNRTKGTPVLDAYTRQPITAHKTRSGRVRATLYQLTAPISYPVMYTLARWFKNQGFSLRVDPTGDNRSHYRLYADHLLNAERSQIPSGNLVIDFVPAR